MKKLVSTMAIAALALTSTFAATTIKLGYSTSASDPRGVASKLFKEDVERNSKGNIKVEIYDNAKLGSDTQLIEGVMAGTVDITMSSAGNFAAHAKNLGVSALPFLFTDFDKAWKFMDSPIVKEVNKDLEAKNIVVLAHFDNGFRCVTTTNKAVNKVADMKGLKIRTPANQIVMESMKALGANPEPLAFSELPAALKEGRFDAQENPIPVIYNNKLYTVQKHLSITNHSYDAMPFVIRKDLWDTFSAADKKIIQNAAIKAQKLNRNMVREQTQSLVANLKKEGMAVTTPDLKEFANATKGVLDMFADVYGKDLMDKVKAFAK